MRPTKNYKTIRQEKKSGIPDNLKNCRDCGKVFVTNGREYLCPACRKKEEFERAKLMDYVRNNPGVTIQQALNNSGVSEKIVKRMVSDGSFSGIPARDTADTAVQASRVCVICGRPIGGTGIYCKSCSARLRHETKNIADQIIVPETKKRRGEMNTVEKLDAQIARELELENLQRQLQSKLN